MLKDDAAENATTHNRQTGAAAAEGAEIVARVENYDSKCQWQWCWKWWNGFGFIIVIIIRIGRIWPS